MPTAVRGRELETLDELQGPVTAEEYLEMLDAPPGELVRGEIIEMGYTNFEHAEIEAKISRKLGNFIEDRNLSGRVLSGDAGVRTARHPDTVRGADVLFISEDRFARNTSNVLIDIGPELIVEIVSPSNTWKGLRNKIGEYFGIGTDHVWIVEPENKAVLVFRAPGEMTELVPGGVLKGEGMLEGFSAPIETIFAA